MNPSHSFDTDTSLNVSALQVRGWQCGRMLAPTRTGDQPQPEGLLCGRPANLPATRLACNRSAEAQLLLFQLAAEASATGLLRALYYCGHMAATTENLRNTMIMTAGKPHPCLSGCRRVPDALFGLVKCLMCNTMFDRSNSVAGRVIDGP